jgi:Flp pilus assembly pilin Flp
MNLRNRLRREDGQTAAEYAVMLGVITAGIVLALGALSGGVANALQRVVDLLP